MVTGRVSMVELHREIGNSTSPLIGADNAKLLADLAGYQGSKHGSLFSELLVALT